MSNRRRVWFEEAGRKLDPGLVEQLHHNRKVDPDETSDDTIPVIVYFNQQTDKQKKMNSCKPVKRKQTTTSTMNLGWLIRYVVT